MLYGAAEFSRDIDFAILADPGNFGRLQGLLNEVRAERIAVPSFDLKHLEAGHAIHFRCLHPEAIRLRLDVMSKMRGGGTLSGLMGTANNHRVARRHSMRSAFAPRPRQS